MGGPDIPEGPPGLPPALHLFPAESEDTGSAGWQWVDNPIGGGLDQSSFKPTRHTQGSRILAPVIGRLLAEFLHLFVDKCPMHWRTTIHCAVSRKFQVIPLTIPASSIQHLRQRNQHLPEGHASLVCNVRALTTESGEEAFPLVSEDARMTLHLQMLHLEYA